MTHWHPDIHDQVLLDLHGAGLTDREITCRMLDAGHPVSSDDVRAARRRLALKANKPELPPAREPCDKPNQLAQAKLWLGKRLVEKPSGYWLDNRPASLATVMKAFNEMRVATGVEQVGNNPSWRV